MEDNGNTFINNKIEEHLHKFGRLGTHLPLKPEGSEYLLDDLKTNNEQEQIVYLCIKKIKEWLEFPKQYKQNNTVTFSPLYMTIQGVGGSGKTFLMNVESSPVFRERNGISFTTFEGIRKVGPDKKSVSMWLILLYRFINLFSDSRYIKISFLPTSP